MVQLQPVVQFFLRLIISLYPTVGTASDLEVASLLILFVLLLLKLSKLLWGASRARDGHLCRNFGLEFRSNEASGNLFGHVLAKASILKLVHHAGFRYHGIESGKVEHDLASVATLQQNILLLINSNESQNLLSKQRIPGSIVINLNQKHNVKLALPFEIKNIEAGTIGVVLVRVVHKTHEYFLEAHEVYLGLIFLVREFEIEYFCITFTWMSEK